MLCMALALCLALPAWAADPEETPTYTLTIKSKTPGHTYEAYQVFSGTLAEDPAKPGTSTLVDLAWGSGVTNTDALVAAIKAITVTKESVETKPFEGCNDANAIAAVLTKENNNSELLDAFAALIWAAISRARSIFLSNYFTSLRPIVSRAWREDKQGGE